MEIHSLVTEIKRAVGMVKVKTTQSSILPNSVNEIAVPELNPCCLSKMAFTGPPPLAVGLMAAPSSEPMAIFNVFRNEIFSLRNLAHKYILREWVNQGIILKTTAITRYICVE